MLSLFRALTMTADNQATPPNWEAQLFRLSVFLAPTARVQDENWWSGIAGSEPETKTIKSNRGEIVEAGPFEGNTLTFSAQPGRADWLLTPSQPNPEDVENIFTIAGQLSTTTDVFTRAMNVWLTRCPPIIRLAYGVVLLERVGGKEEGYRRLAGYLPSIKIDVSSQDFFYQINRPRQMRHTKDNLTVNRLAKWSVAAVQQVRMAFALGAPPAVSGVLYAPPESIVHACRVELDISSPAQRSEELNHDELPAMFAEFVSLGSEIASEGDIP